MSRRYFVTGTDTEVGKTAVSCALLHAAGALGLRTAAVKPAAAGCDAQGHNEDALALQAAMNISLPYEQVNPVALQPAIAPHIAAARVGKRLQVERLAGLCRGVFASGCINHALLTAEAIRADGLRLAGWVANQPGERMSCHEENVDTLRQLLPAPLLGELPHLSPFDPEVAAQHIDIKVLL